MGDVIIRILQIKISEIRLRRAGIFGIQYLHRNASQCEMGANAILWIIITSFLWILSGVSTARMKRKLLEQNSSLELLIPLPAQSSPKDQSGALTASKDEMMVASAQTEGRTMLDTPAFIHRITHCLLSVPRNLHRGP